MVVLAVSIYFPVSITMCATFRIPRTKNQLLYIVIHAFLPIIKQQDAAFSSLKTNQSVICGGSPRTASFVN